MRCHSSTEIYSVMCVLGLSNEMYSEQCSG